MKNEDGFMAFAEITSQALKMHTVHIRALQASNDALMAVIAKNLPPLKGQLMTDLALSARHHGQYVDPEVLDQFQQLVENSMSLLESMPGT